MFKHEEREPGLYPFHTDDGVFIDVVSDVGKTRQIDRYQIKDVSELLRNLGVLPSALDV